jgi:aryl-alcohol dehydrogenase-like predicted oxidoreductase
MFRREKMEHDYLHLFRYHGLGTTIWSPLASGLLSGKYNNGFPEGTRLGIEGMDWLKDRVLREEKLAKVKALASLANDLGVSMSKLSIAWCLKNPHVSTVILGASKTSQLTENLTAFEVVPMLTEEVMNRIDAIMGNKPVQPEY